PLSPVGAILLALGGPGMVALTLVTFGAGGPGREVVGMGVVAIVVGAVLLGRPPRLGRVREGEALSVPERAPASGRAIEVEGVWFTYPGAGEAALRGVTFGQEAGSVALLMGRTGAGKSTLCRCLNGLIPSYLRGELRGAVRLNGADIAGRHVAELAQTIGLVFQDFETQLVSSDARSEVAFALESFGRPREEMRRRVGEALAAVRLERLAGNGRRDPATLSGGEKQRLAIASVLASRPPLLVLDEPTTDLDPVGKAELFQVARELHEQGITLLIAEHETSQALSADRLLVLREGELAFDGPPAELLRDPDRTGELSLHPLEMPQLFAALGCDERPLTVAEAAKSLLAGGWELDAPSVAELRGVDERRRQRYGDLVVTAEGVAHRYGDYAALDGVSLGVREGEFIAILGQNGCGKTTLAKHLNGLLKPTEGRVVAGGQDTRQAPIADLARVVGYVFQDPDHQIFEQRVDREVAFGLRNLGIPEEETEARVREALEAVGLWEKREADPFTLTKGERQRLATASVLACRPRVIILDEPTTGLDGAEQRRMMELLRRLNEQGHTIIVITHCMWAAARYAHRVVVLSDGKVVADASAREVFGDLDLLARNCLEAPDIVRLSGEHYGFAALTVEEMVGCLERQ
ncbi:MAG: ABC transporter ATP-binding protein, partial [Armatimonadota bacterium]